MPFWLNAQVRGVSFHEARAMKHVRRSVLLGAAALLALPFLPVQEAVVNLPRRPVFGKIRQNVARFRLYRHRFLQENMRLTAFFKIYQIFKLNFLKFEKNLQFLRHLQFFC